MTMVILTVRTDPQLLGKTTGIRSATAGALERDRGILSETGLQTRKIFVSYTSDSYSQTYPKTALGVETPSKLPSVK